MRTVDEWKALLRSAIKEAMRRREGHAVAALRETLAAIDNAEAVPAEHSGYVARSFGDPSGEVARRALDGDEVEALLAVETESRLAAAADYARHGREADAARLREEAALIGRYRARTASAG